MYLFISPAMISKNEMFFPQTDDVLTDNVTIFAVMVKILMKGST